MSTNAVATIDVDGILISHSITELADAINSEYQQAQSAMSKGLLHTRKCGEYLLLAKEQHGHGTWLQWLSDNCPAIAERTAQVAMKIARNWTAIEGKSATVADLTINEALKLIPLKVEPIDDRYLQWYDHKADEVWGHKIQHVMAFRRVVTYPDIMDRLSTEQILPLAQAVYDEHIRLDRDITESSIVSSVKHRFKEAFAKKREETSKHNELVRELRDGEVAFRKSQQAISRIDYLTKNNPDLKIEKTGFAGLGFESELSNLVDKLTNSKPVEQSEKEVFDVLPMLPAIIKPELDATAKAQRDAALDSFYRFSEIAGGYGGEKNAEFLKSLLIDNTQYYRDRWKRSLTESLLNLKTLLDNKENLERMIDDVLSNAEV